jgi:hypothetical protein
MATPKGMRLKQVKVNPTDKIHVYSNGNHVWLQLRRDVPTEDSINKASFKTAFCLTGAAARELGEELVAMVTLNQEKQRAKAGSTPSV